MEITEVRIFPRESQDRKLKAYATITIDDAFVVRNVKVIEGNKGLFVAMPSRKLRDACPKCNYKNAIGSKFCNQCGASLPPVKRREERGEDTRRQSGHKDIAHPITPECREYIQKKVLGAYNDEIKGGKPSIGPRAEKPKEIPKEKPEKKESKFETPEAAGTDAVTPDTDEDFEGDLEL